MDSPASAPFTVDPSLSSYQISAQDYLKDSDGTQGVAGAALVFYGQRILLVQRSAHDSNPNRWEIPGGACDPEDDSILHGAVREVFEETGLHVTAITGIVGEGQKFLSSRRLRIIKFSFMAEVREADECKSYKNMPVKIDPNEHQNWLWATVDEVLAGKSGDVELVFSSPEQKEIILEGLRRHSSA
jgi:8-oxo-dGTP pyrophosphatase MutT (NUDIX family)